VSHVGPFRRYYWFEGWRSEPSWLWSWIDSPEDHFAKRFSFFPTHFFAGFIVFFSSLPRHPLSCFCHLHCLSSPARHTPPPTTLLHMPLAPISPYPPPPLVALVSCRNPPQTPLKTLEFSLCFFLQALCSSVWRPPHDLVSPFDAGQVLPRPPKPSHMHFWSHDSSSPCQAHSPGLHFLEVFFVGVGISAQKGSFPPFPHLLCCFC
jgi:hypothetical protein